MSDDSRADGPAHCPRHAARSRLFAWAGWLIAAGASLSVSAIPYDTGELLCGVWGCFPPLQALAAMHLFWAVVLAAAVWVVGVGRPKLLGPFGSVLALAAAVAIVTVVGRDLVQWLDHASDGVRRFWPKRIFYTLATTTDLPLVEGLIAGLVCIGLASRRRRLEKRHPDRVEAGPAEAVSSGV